MNETLDVQPETPAVDPVATSETEKITEQAVESPAKEQAVEGATTSDEAQQEEVKKKTGFQKRIDELTRQKYERDHQISQRDAYIQSLQSQLEQTQAQQTDATKPTIEQFDYDAESYAKAYENWVENRQQQAVLQQKELQQRASAQQQHAARQQQLQMKIMEAQARFPDFMQTINDPSLPNLQEINQAAYEAVIDSEDMGSVAMHLAKNPEKVYAFAQMSPVQAIREVAKLEVMLGAGTPQSPKPPPPPPATDIRGKSDVKADPTKMSTDQYIKWRNENMKR